ncbi:MAG: DUF6240 domain-containing protein [Clostridium sp.]|nr:DUF6240 domain-containing protein [Acetatifactor muris]MCM1527785.1 DUF6240 domain-containing protein [Bacteroides sp.]MCM1563880.1 DUF6240 domain-containing protein [Clostridium sp.]
MNISFQNQDKRTDAGTAGYPERTGYGRDARTSNSTERRIRTEEKSSVKKNVSGSANVTFSVGEDGLNVFGDLGVDREGWDKGKTLTDLQQEASYVDVGVSQDYMTLMSHTMSEEDYRELSEEGFHFASLDPEQAVTIVDRIKAELVRSGKEIAGYTDDLDMDTLAAAVGSETLARALTDSFREMDVPLTEENVAAVEKAWNMASGLETPTEGAYEYMVDNEMEPEIWNFYLAENSGADSAGRDKNTSAEDMAYLREESIQKQIDRVLEQAGYEPNEENRQAAMWLLERRLPLTAESVQRLKDLRDVTLPVTEEDFARAAAAAVAEGKEPLHADLSPKAHKSGNLYERAVEILDYYRSQYDEAVRDYESGSREKSESLFGGQSDLTARRQLEEIRLRMTAEVNVRLLKSGFAIDTAPMEQLIEALREAEQAVAERYFPDDAEAVSKYENWNAANEVMRDLPTLPAQLLGTVRVSDQGEESATVLEHFHAEGMVLKETYERAGESYESLMTAPRADLGDSMRKAFGNVDELLRELGLEPTEENRRVVRILGYNHMEITEDNLDRVKDADAQVRALIEKMTPAATLKMIRDGINPLEQSFEQLNQYFDELPESYREQAESYSRFLYGLERNGEITQQERESYIGVYRLLHQIERRDGAAIGSIVNTQAELQFANLLSAVRSGKFRHMDVRATDELGVLRELVREGENKSVSDQISAAYDRDELAGLRRVTETDAEVTALLERGEIPANAENLLAAQELVQKGRNPFQELKQKRNTLWERLSDKEAFRAEYGDAVEEMQSEAENMTFEEKDSFLDVRALQMTHRQISIIGNLARSEEYFLSMDLGDEEALVHLTLEHGTDEKGGISITVQYGEDSRLEARLQVQNGRVDGFLLGNTSEEVTKLQKASDIFYNLINENTSLNLEAMKLPVVSKGNINMTGTSENSSQGENVSLDNGKLYHVAKLFLQAIK